MAESGAVTYRFRRAYRAEALGMSAVFGCAAVVLLIAALNRSSEAAFFVLWAAGVCVGDYYFLFRLAYEATLEGDAVRWRAPLTSGVIPLTELKRFGRSGWHAMDAFHVSDGRSVPILTRARIKPFLDALRAVSPNTVVDPSWGLRTELRLEEAIDHLPRRRRRWLLLALVAVFTLSVATFAAGVLDGRRRSQAIKGRSVAVEGTIVRYRERYNGASRAMVRYRVGDTTVVNEAFIDRDSALGDRLALRYDPEHPERVFEPGDREPPGGEVPDWIALGFLGAGVSGAATFGVWRRRRNDPPCSTPVR